MNCVVEKKLNGIQSENTLMQDTKKEMIKNEGRPKLNSDELKTSVTELFPWIIEFRQMCKCIHTEKSMASLTKLMQFYVRNVSVSVNECYTRPLRAAKLKDSISETLMLFLYIYRELSEDQDRSVYLNNMSDLLALYIDMELKASKKSKEDHDKICARLTSCLYIYLEHSIEHLLDTLIKIQFMYRNYHHILDPVIKKIIKNIPTHPESSIMYIRYFFTYRLWKKINDNAAVKNQITTTALASLGSLPSTFSPTILEDVLPKVPKSQPNSTKALLQHKFDIKKHCEMFVQYCRESNGNVCYKDGPATLIDSSSRINSQMPEDITPKDVAEHVDNNVNSIISDKAKQTGSNSFLQNFKSLNLEQKASFKCLGSFSNNISTKHVTPKVIELNRKRSRRKCKKSNEIVIIDLTSDVVSEKCIKKRKSRRLPWLEEAKKRIDLKIIKSSQKIKKKEWQENIHRTHSSDVSRNHQSKDTSQLVHATDNNSSKNDSNTCRMVESNENKMEIDIQPVDRTENARKPIGTEVNIKEVNNKLSTGTIKPVLTEINLQKQVANDTVAIGNCLTYNDAPHMQCNEKENDRCNKQTVIKRLIETDTSSESRQCEKVESLKKICDLEPDCPAVNNATEYTQYYFKDDAVKSNGSEFNVINHERTSKVTMSEQLEQSDQNASNNEYYISDYSHKLVNSEIKCEELGTVKSSYVAENETSKGTLKSEEKQQSCLFIENSLIQESFESQTPLKSLKCTNAMSDAEGDKLCTQTELEICNYSKVNENIREDKSIIANSRESIFESYSVDKKDISNTVDVTCPSEHFSNNGNSCIDTNSSKYDNISEYDDKRDTPPEDKKLSHLSSEVISKRECGKLYKVTEQEDVCSVTENKYLVQESELQDNIDGLSLLASVSQHVPHLKPEFEVKCDQIKVKDYASLKYACYNQITDDETDTNDSSNTVSQLLENPSSEIINRIVGVYPEDALDKVALRVEVKSNQSEGRGGDDELCKVDTHNETAINYDTDTLTHNLTPIESTVQTVKENTNVILNGETVVLLQKSPNSNLYIINKAVENLKDHNDEEISKLKEKAWISSSEECGQFEAITSLDHVSYNLELTPYKELPYQENKCSVAHGKGIKMEPEDLKSYSKKVPLSTDILSVNSQIYQDVNVLSKSMDKRKSSKSSLAYRQNIKQEYNNIPNHIASNCAIAGCNGIHSHPHEVDAQHPLHIPATHPTTLPSIYANCAGNADLCVPYHKHCTSVSCNLQLNPTTSLHSHTKSGSPPCGRSHCSCLNCTYDIVARCRQCIHPATDTHVSCIESSPYFLPTHSSVQSPTVQEHERGKSETVIGKLYDDQLLCKIEKSFLQSSTLEKLENDSENVFKKDADNKLPLKKRLKVHAMAYGKVPIKAEKLDNYPAMPMMSIAALEALDNTQKRSAQILKTEYELPPTKEDPHDDYHYNSNVVRRDYYKEVASVHQDLTKESTRNERQFRSANDQSNDTGCQEACLQRTVKTPAERKEVNLSMAPLKRIEMESMGQEVAYKRVKKTQTSNLRQTRSSKRNVPKVNYSYTDVDPEWNPSGESKRKRKKTSR